jgi:hypothetical protein
MTTPIPSRRRGVLSSLLLLGALVLTGRPSQAQVDTYTFAPSVGTYTPLPTTATLVTSINSDDDVTSALPIGFNFTFDGTVYTQVYANSNGFISFNSGTPGSGSYTNSLSTVSANYRPMAALYWDDLTGSGGTTRYQTTGTAPNRTFTFEWLNWQRLSASGAQLSFQVQLVEGTNVMRFVYRPESTPISSASASVGLAGVGTGSGSFLSLSDVSTSPSASSSSENSTISTVPVAGQIYTFTPAAPSPCPAPRLLAGTTTTTTATLTWQTTNAAAYTVVYGPTGFNPAVASSPTNVYTTVTGITTPSTSLTGLTPGTTYQFYVTANCGGTNGSSVRSNPGTFTTQIINDEPCGAIALTVNNTCTPLNTTTFGATISTGVPSGNCSNFPTSTPYDVWYRFTTAATGPTSTSVRITVTGGAANTLRVYSGTSCSGQLNFLNCSSANDESTASPDLDATGLTPSTTYYVRVGSYNSFSPVAGGSFTICAVPVPNCPAPTGLTVGALTNTTAVVSWSTASPGSTSTVIYGPAGFLPPSGTGSSTVTGVTNQTTTLTNLQPNTAYEFYVQQVCGSFNGSSILAGPFPFNTPLTAPLNDEPCGAIGLNATVRTGTTIGATSTSALQPSITTPVCSPSAQPKDVWYAFTANGATATFTLTGTAAGMLRIYSSPSCSAGPFALIFCAGATGNNVGFTAPINATGLTAGRRYYLAVSGYGSSDAAGSFTLAAAGIVTATSAKAETEALVVYPNPSNTGTLTLKLAATGNTGQASLLNALGQVVLTKNLTNAAEQTLTTRGLAAGLYTLRVTAQGQTLTRKVVLE